MVTSISQLLEPIGAITEWIRPDNTIPLPFGWLICDGSTVSDSESTFNGKALPDLRGKFPRGHATLSNANFAADTLYFTGGTVPTGGADTVDLSHVHSMPTHRHTINALATSSRTSTNAFLGWPFGDVGVGTHSHTFPQTNTEFTAPTANTAGSSSEENRPTFTEMVTIIKVK